MEQSEFRKEVKKLGKVIFDEVTKRANKVAVYKRYFSNIYFTLPNGFKVNYCFHNECVELDRKEHIPGYYGDDRYHGEYLHSEHVCAYPNQDLGFFVSASITHYEDGYEKSQRSSVVTCDKEVYSSPQPDLSIEEQEKILEILRSIIEELPKLEIDKSITREEYDLEDLTKKLKQASKQMPFRRALKSLKERDPYAEVLPSVEEAVEWWFDYVRRFVELYRFYYNPESDTHIGTHAVTFRKALSTKLMESLSSGDPVVISAHGTENEVLKEALKEAHVEEPLFLQENFPHLVLIRMNISIDEVKVTYFNTMSKSSETDVIYSSSKEPDPVKKI